MDAPIPEQSRRQLQDLFLADAIVEKQWVMLVPKCEEAVKCTPSDSDRYFLKIYGCQQEVKRLLSCAFDNIFVKKGHVMTYWDDLAMNVIHKLGLTYRDLTNGKLEKYSEAQLQQMILNPMIREISKAASIIPEIKHEVIKTAK